MGERSSPSASWDWGARRRTASASSCTPSTRSRASHSRFDVAVTGQHSGDAEIVDVQFRISIEDRPFLAVVTLHNVSGSTGFIGHMEVVVHIGEDVVRRGAASDPHAPVERLAPPVAAVVAAGDRRSSRARPEAREVRAHSLATLAELGVRELPSPSLSLRDDPGPSGRSRGDAADWVTGPLRGQPRNAKFRRRFSARGERPGPPVRGHLHLRRAL